MNQRKIKEILKNRLSAELYRHVLGVAQTAAELAVRYGADEQKAAQAGLLHDYAKEMEPAALLKKAKLLGVPLDPVTRMEGHKLLHAPVGAALLQAELGLRDSAVLSAVSCHTTGKPSMTVLEKVLYLADFIEPNRDFDGVGTLRDMSRVDLDRAVLTAVNLTVTLVLKRDMALHPDSVNLRNQLIARIRGEEKEA